MPGAPEELPEPFGAASRERVLDPDRAPRAEPAFAYMSCCVGEQRYLPYLPEALLCADAVAGDESEALLELGVFAFVASRI